MCIVILQEMCVCSGSSDSAVRILFAGQSITLWLQQDILQGHIGLIASGIAGLKAFVMVNQYPELHENMGNEPWHPFRTAI